MTSLLANKKEARRRICSLLCCAMRSICCRTQSLAAHSITDTFLIMDKRWNRFWYFVIIHCLLSDDLNWCILAVIINFHAHLNSTSIASQSLCIIDSNNTINTPSTSDYLLYHANSKAISMRFIYEIIPEMTMESNVSYHRRRMRYVLLFWK